jgi:precorrin-4/cobalt-precorrin-4 C11-methyltransferase
MVMERTLKKPSTVHFVGSGPGDPELITVKGKRLLEEADIVVYTGSLLKEKVLCWCKEGVKIFNSASMDLEEITALIIKASKEGERVVRLHTGDPALYSAVAEQMDIFNKAGVPYEVTPGVNAASAAAASLKSGLTMPEVCQTVILTRYPGKTLVPDTEKISILAAHRATICIFLSVSMIDQVVSELREGYPPDTPAAVVYRASWEDELIVRGTLGDIARKVKEAGIKRHAVILVGRSIGEESQRSRLYSKEFKHGFRK